MVLNMTINEYLEDFDNSELDPYEWEEQMRDAIHDYNREYNAHFPWKQTISAYKAWKRKKNPMLSEDW